MNARKLAIVALIPLVALMTGCGRAPGTAADTTEERAVPQMNFEKKVGQPKAVIVDGRAFVEGKAPAVFVAPDGGTPADGKGNLRATIAVTTMGDNTYAVSFHVMKGEKYLHADLWEKADLNVTALGSVAKDLEPGEYTLLMNRYNKAMGVFAQKSIKATVEAGKTLDVKF